jgi:hypothetical protein
MMTMGNRNFMDSSKAKRRDPIFLRRQMAGHGTVKKIEADFRRISASRRNFFNRLARPSR